jgi:hypothetical protein
MMPFAARDDVPADFVDQDDSLAVLVMTGDHASDLQGHGAFRYGDRDELGTSIA